MQPLLVFFFPPISLELIILNKKKEKGRAPQNSELDTQPITFHMPISRDLLNTHTHSYVFSPLNERIY
jgi:hypothetical protein